ncbi:MAG TPA: lysine--tRNA ligase [Steroidobacteraceae bacterium]|nr:lysine--tRNA ligase [Steroidobacteraceae bacterium]
MSQNSDNPPNKPDTQDENKLIAERRAKLAQWRETAKAAHTPAFPNDFRRDVLATLLQTEYGDKPAEWFDANPPIRLHVAGRMMSQRVMGKVSFAKLQDRTGQIQVFLQRDALGEAYEAFKKFDVGDILGATGTLFKTKTGELSVRADSVRLLTKSLRPLPDKWHGMADVDTRYRQRYVDLIVNEQSRKVFTIRNQVLRYLRDFLDSMGFMEVETPMLQSIPGGAAARPFKTHHNALDMDMYLRIAPELYLKRLTVGGFERVYEINRNFRNEGVSTRHNPEFTMLELYVAYADYNDLIVMIERAMQGLADVVLGSRLVEYQGRTYDLGKPFTRISVIDAVAKYVPGGFDMARARDVAYLRELCTTHGIKFKPGDGAGKLQIELFEKFAEDTFDEPTFAYAYPAEVSPLSRANDSDPFLTDRFEFFLAGRELANGFSELNDAEDQAARFRAQVERKDAGDDEAMYYDADYVRALEYGMPPTAGLGVGIDRLVMFFANVPSIRDVLLFPHMRPETI